MLVHPWTGSYSFVYSVLRLKLQWPSDLKDQREEEEYDAHTTKCTVYIGASSLDDCSAQMFPYNIFAYCSICRVDCKFARNKIYYVNGLLLWSDFRQTWIVGYISVNLPNAKIYGNPAMRADGQSLRTDEDNSSIFTTCQCKCLDKKTDVSQLFTASQQLLP
jgi:hypothetical protein